LYFISAESQPDVHDYII